jgi:hypothetical protein
VESQVRWLLWWYALVPQPDGPPGGCSSMAYGGLPRARASPRSPGLCRLPGSAARCV